ncbi:MAG: hypothetical protein WB873_00325, partial [Thermoplasmata archaeon]
MNRRLRLRKWRLRGRRGQVAAVATILGLLLVVTFIANYLTATLPGQMSVNELNHEIQVQDQVGRLQALLEAASSADAVGAQFTQPITLGGAGQPPFAGADSASIGPTSGLSFNLTFSLAGPLVYAPPTGGTPNSGIVGSCTLGAASLVCAGTNHVTYNFSAAVPTNYAITSSGGGTYVINITDSGTSNASRSTVALTVSGALPFTTIILGSNLN